MFIKKFKLIAVFFFGILFVFGLILSYSFFKTHTAHGDVIPNRVVYADALDPQFVNWSWNSNVNLSNTSPVNAGSSSLSFTPNPWGAFYVHTANAINPASYASLQFAMQTSDPEKNFTLIFYDTNNQQIKSLPLSQYPGTDQNSWKMYTIPMAQFSQPIGGFALQETSGAAGPVTYLDTIQFIANQPASIAQTATAASSPYTIYSDALMSGWVNWSWNSNVSFANTTPVAQGTNSVSFTTTAGYGGFYLHTEQGVDSSPYQSLTFMAKAAGAGASYMVTAYDTNNQQTHALVSLANYGGQPDANNWKNYVIPLTDISANGKIIKGILIQDASGNAQQTLYLDAIGFNSTAATMQTVLAVPTTVVTTAPTPTSAPVVQSVAVVNVSGNPLAGATFYNNPDANPAKVQQQQWQVSRPADATQIAKIADQPKAIWIGNWNTNVQSDVKNSIDKSGATVPVFVAYNMPNRDCGSYSSGGAGSVATYNSWITSFAQGIGSHRAVIILEPDALAQITCLSAADQSQRYLMLTNAVQTFKSLGNTSVYIDAGHAGWIGASDMANRLNQAGIAKADGFSLNVSNFMTTSDSITYGSQLTKLVAGKHFVIDTSRNGNGPTGDNAWCNPAGRALGEKPTTQTGNALVDAYLWIKYPGESDGTCNGGPAAGAWFADYALGLAQQARW